MKRDKSITIIIPFFNEEESLLQLYKGIKLVTKNKNLSLLEMIFINDGSTDDSSNVIKKIASKDKMVKLINLRRNMGKSYALQSGFDLSNGEIVITMDGDLQDDPTELPKFIDKINQGYDLVSGWKKKRNDPKLSKTIPSRIFNLFIRAIFKVPIHDINCGFKAYKRNVVKSVEIYGELHRFIPILADSFGYTITEISIKHNSRKYGMSKYGASRFIKGMLDLTIVYFTTRFFARPNHVFGGLGMLLGLFGSIGLLYLFTLWVSGIRPIGDRPLFLFSILLIITSVQLASFGILAEMISKSNKKLEIHKYIASTVNIDH